MGPIIPAHQPRQNYAKMIGEQLSEGAKAFLGQQRLGRENEALKSRGIDVTGINDPDARSQIIAHELAYGKKKRAIDATRESGYGNEKGASTSRGSSENKSLNKKEPLPGFMGRDEGIEPKKGLYTQKTTQGDLQPVKSFEQVKDEGIDFARRATDNGYPMSDQEGMEYVNQKNNEILNSNQRIQSEQRSKQGERSAFNQKGQQVALNTIGKTNLTPEVATHFGKRAEQLAEIVDTESDLDKKLAEEIRNYKNTVAVATNSINAPPRKTGIGQDRLDQKAIGDLRTKLNPLLKMGFYDKARDILSQKGYGPEERESIVSSLSENTNKALGGMPKIPKKSRIEYARGPEIVPDYTEQEMDLINNTMSDIFTNDPSTNLVLLRKSMRDEKDVDWRAFKDGLDYAIYTGKLDMNPEQLNQYSRMSEPDETGLEQLLRLFGVGGK